MSQTLRLLFTVCIFASFFASCKEENRNPYRDLSIDYFDSIKDSTLSSNSYEIREWLQTLRKADRDTMYSDNRTQAFYKQTGHSTECFLWINRHGINPQAHSLIACLDSCEADGLHKELFRLDQIHKDIERIEALDFAEDKTDKYYINRILARLEYNLTKAFLKYAVGQRYGFCNPKKILNSLDPYEDDTLNVRFHHLFDVNMHIAGKETYKEAIDSIRQGKVDSYLRCSQQKSRTYNLLKEALHKGQFERDIILLNMERARWKAEIDADKEKEYVAVNIPSYHLWAVRDGQCVTDMRIGCGSSKTKTPLLYSRLKRMDINPKWYIPMSIRKKDMIHHAGSEEYFNSRNYYAQNKKTGKKLTGSSITYDIITSTDWNIVQEGGNGNALGRIIFRFDNNFAIYLHDTSTRAFFSRDNRSVSHGCIRVEKPYDLACFMLRNEDEEMAERIKYSMEADLQSDDCDKKKLVWSNKIDPDIALFLYYYTLFPTPGSDVLQRYPDVYGYDAAIRKAIPELLYHE